jgi:hypothetical protein
MTIDAAILESAMARKIDHEHLVAVLGVERVQEIQSSINLGNYAAEKRRLDDLGAKIKATYSSLPHKEPDYDVTTGEQYAL